MLPALNAGPWLRGFAESAHHPQLVDEALLSEALGLPARFLPYLLASVAVIAFMATMRLHPPQGRVLAILLVGLGGASGFLLWMKLVGPILLLEDRSAGMREPNEDRRNEHGRAT